MTLPSNFRSLFFVGVFCVAGGAWLTLVTGVRTLPLRDAGAASAIPECDTTSNRTETVAALRLRPIVIATPEESYCASQ